MLFQRLNLAVIHYPVFNLYAGITVIDSPGFKVFFRDSAGAKYSALTDINIWPYKRFSADPRFFVNGNRTQD
ncbi:hypothetical protein NUKP771_23730 [Klebsiella quasipneumoniae]|nr:hypothetical protein NUKP771_23730 [Klebsiella quasipneumoniae]